MDAFEVWRKMINRYEPKHGARYMSLLNEVLNPTFDQKIEEYEDGLLSWEQKGMDYEDASGEKVSDNTMRSVITSYSPTALQLHVQVTASSV